MARSVLGKGVGALFSEQDAKNISKAENVSRETNKVRISLIEPNNQQPRKNFDEEALNELADSIKKYGILQPLLVKKTGQTYQIIAGERRWRAAKIAGLTEVPVIEKNLADMETAEVALIENLQREDLNPVEEAMAYRDLIEEYGLKQEELAEKVSKNRTTITNSLRLLQLGDELLSKISEGKLSAGHARALLAVEDSASRKQLADRVINLGLSVRETEKMAKNTKENKKEKPAENTSADAYLKDVARQLTKSLGTKVSLKPGKDGAGKLEIEYYSTEGLNALLEKLR